MYRSLVPDALTKTPQRSRKSYPPLLQTAEQYCKLHWSCRKKNPETCPRAQMWIGAIWTPFPQTGKCTTNVWYCTWAKPPGKVIHNWKNNFFNVLQTFKLHVYLTQLIWSVSSKADLALYNVLLFCIEVQGFHRHLFTGSREAVYKLLKQLLYLEILSNAADIFHTPGKAIAPAVWYHNYFSMFTVC